MAPHSVRRTAFSIAATLTLAGVLVSQAQNPGTRTILFSATGKGGKPVTDLRFDEVKVSEDGKAQTATTLVSTGSEPLFLTVLLDASGSSLAAPTYWQTEVKAFLSGLLRPGIDQGTVLYFDSRTYMLQPPTDDIPLLTAAVDKVRMGGATALYDALLLTARAAGQAPGRKTLLLLSDGYDTASRESREAALKAVQENDVLVYAVATEPVERQPARFGRPTPLGKEFLEDLVQETGGRYRFVRNAKEIRTGLAEIADELRSQYAITYPPSTSSSSSTFQKVKLAVTRKDVKLQHRSGYYPAPAK